MAEEKEFTEIAGRSSCRVIWQDEDFVVVAKPPGVLVDSGGRESDVVSWAQANGSKSAFAFHRLDRATSGLVLLGRTRRYARDVTEMFEKKQIRKSYLALVEGAWPVSLNRVDLAIEGKPAVTTFRRLGFFQELNASLLECLPKTGRTHQIRIHASQSGHAILGDARYGRALNLPSSSLRHSTAVQALHAYRLLFRHPKTNETVDVQASDETSFDAWPLAWQKVVREWQSQESR